MCWCPWVMNNAPIDFILDCHELPAFRRCFNSGCNWGASRTGVRDIDTIGKPCGTLQIRGKGPENNSNTCTMHAPCAHRAWYSLKGLLSVEPNVVILKFLGKMLTLHEILPSMHKSYS